MKKSQYTEEQIIGILKQHEAGVKTADQFLGHDVILPFKLPGEGRLSESARHPKSAPEVVQEYRGLYQAAKGSRKQEGHALALPSKERFD